MTTHFTPAGDPATGATPAPVLATSNAAGSATTFLRSNDQLAVFDTTNPAAIGTAATGSVAFTARRDHVHPTGAGTPVTQAFGDAAAVGTGPAAAMTDHRHGMPASPSSGAVTREGGNLAGGTTTSTTVVDLVTVSVSIANAKLVLVTFAGFKNNVGANSVALGLTVNATLVLTPVAGSVGFYYSTAANAETQGGTAMVWLGPGSASVRAVNSYFSAFESATWRAGGFSVANLTTALPNATYTSIIITALTSNAATYCAVENINIYSYANS